jgi:LysR family hydrogen peroxide-inducible transcriptional activator
MIPKVHEKAPSMPLYIEENYTHVLRTKLEQGDLDAIIVALPFSGGGLVRARMYEESFSVLLPAKHPWTQQKQIEPEQLLDETLLLLGEGHCFRDQVLELCPAIDSQRQKNLIQIEGGSLETLRHMVASGLGITVLPASAVNQHSYSPDTFAVRPFAGPAPARTIALVWRDSFPRPRAIEVVRQSVPKNGLTG